MALPDSPIADAERLKDPADTPGNENVPSVFVVVRNCPSNRLLTEMVTFAAATADSSVESRTTPRTTPCATWRTSSEST